MARTIIASLCAALVVVLVMLVVPWPKPGLGRSGGTSSAQDYKSERNGSMDAANQPPSKRPREERGKAVEVTDEPTALDTHTPEQIAEFFLPEIQLEDASIGEAVAEVLEAYRDICSQTGQVPLEFDLNLPNAAFGSISVDLTGHSLLSALRLLGAHAGMKMNQVGTSLAFSVAPPTELDLDLLKTPPPSRIKYSTRVMTSPRELGFLENGVYSPSQFDEVLRRFEGQQSGALALPSLVLRSGQEAKIRIPGEEDPAITASARPYGFGVSAANTVDAVERENPSGITAWDVVPPGHWVVRSEQTEDGTYRYYFLSPTAVPRPLPAPGNGS